MFLGFLDRSLWNNVPRRPPSDVPELSESRRPRRPIQKVPRMLPEMSAS